MKRQSPWKVLGIGFIAVVFCAGQLLHAEVTGTVMGTVSDPSGAAVANAAVTLRNLDTGQVRTLKTTASGTYEFLSVPVGNYSVQVQAPGFRSETQSGIKLDVNQQYRADFSLKVGAINEKIEVSANGAQVDTTNTQLGDVISDKKMTTLPLNGRSYIDLLGLQAGVVPVASSDAVNDRPVSGNGNSGQMSVNGERESANSFLVNGGDVEESVNNGASIVPTLDSIQEFRLMTSSFNAEYGRFAGAIVNVITKSGTNEFHGSAYEFLRNDALDARGYFDPTRPALKRNQFGGTIGMPVIKNKLFFFGDYQGTREVAGVSTGIIPVPSTTERAGDFSDLGTTGFGAFTGSVRSGSDPTNFAPVLTNRLGYKVVPGESYWFSGCNTTDYTSATGCVFPANQTACPGSTGPCIPHAAWSPAAVGTLMFVPTPTGTSGGQPFFSSASQNSNVRDEKFGVRIDLNTAHRGNWTGYYHWDDANYLNPLYQFSAAKVPGFPVVTPSRAQQIQASNTALLNASTVNEVRLNYTRFAFLKNVPQGGLGDITKFGFVKGGLGIIPSNPKYEGIGTFTFNNTGFEFGQPDGITGQYNNGYQITDNFTKVTGRHTLRFGGDVRYIQVNERNTYTPNGWFQFSGGETGNDFADYLLGAPDAFNQTSLQLLDSRTKYFGLYAQDTFKATPDLTINYGLRWDVSQPFYDTKNRLQTFVPGKQSRIYPDAPEGFEFPGDPGVPRTLAPTQYNRFAPRLGIAYSPNVSDGILGKIVGGPGKTSIHLGGGIYYTAIEDLTLFNEVGDAPFGLFYVSPVPVYMEKPYQARAGAAGFPGQRFPFTIPPPGATGIWDQYLPIATAPTFRPSNKLPYSEQFNFTIQHEIARTTVLTVGYVGSRGHHLLNEIEQNPGNAATCLLIASLMPAGQGCGQFGEDTIYTTPSNQTFYGTRPYSVTSGRGLPLGLLDFQSNPWEATEANSTYNALQASLQKDVGNFRFLGAYTWSKSIDNSSGFYDEPNPYVPAASRGLSTFDVTHNFVLSYSYDLPFAKLAHGFRGKVLSGWTVTGITRFTTGFPVTLSESKDASLCGCGGADVPNYNGQPIHFLNVRKTGQWFDTSPFSPEVTGVFGNSGRRFFHGPGINNWDFSLHKGTPITEKTNLEFRVEYFNIFNHAQFSSVTGDILGSFGAVTGARAARIGQAALKFSF